MIRLGGLALRHSGLVEVSRPHLRRLHALTGETVCLFVIAGRDRLCVDAVPSQHGLRMTVELGSTRPLHAGAAGKVLLAALDRDQVHAILGEGSLARITPRTVTDPVVLRRQLGDVAQAGVAVTEGEYVPGSAAIAAPIVGKEGAVAGAVNLLGPRVRLTPSRILELVPVVKDTAETISRQLGHVRGAGNPA